MAKIHLGIPWDAKYVMHTLWQYRLKRSRFTDKLDTTFEDAPTETCHERYLKSTNNGVNLKLTLKMAFFWCFLASCVRL